MVGLNGVATASVAYHESVAYARDAHPGPTGRRAIRPRRWCRSSQHADVRRMLLRQKAIVMGGLSLVARVVAVSDLAAHGKRRARGAAARSADADRQVVPGRARLRVEHARAPDPRRLRLLERVLARSVAARSEAQLDPRGHDRHPGARSARPARCREGRGRARGAGRRDRKWRARVRATPASRSSVDRGPSTVRSSVVGELTSSSRSRARRRSRRDAASRHGLSRSVRYRRHRVAVARDRHGRARRRSPVRCRAGRASRDARYYRVKLAAAQYWIQTELPRIDHLAKLCSDGEGSYANMDVDGL